jgi:hypothetical protein
MLRPYYTRRWIDYIKHLFSNPSEKKVDFIQTNCTPSCLLQIEIDSENVNSTPSHLPEIPTNLVEGYEL